MGYNFNSGYGLAKSIAYGKQLSSGRTFIVCPSTHGAYDEINQIFKADVTGKLRLYSTITAAESEATSGDGDVILVAEGSYNETVTVNTSDLTIIGLGGRGAAFIEPTTAGAEGMQIAAGTDDVTLINLGVASDDTGSYALNLNSAARFRAYGCKFECAGPATGTVAVLMDGTATDQTADALFYDCEFAWCDSAILFDDSAYGYVTQIRIQNCWFHNFAVVGVGVATGGLVNNLALIDNVFDQQEDGTEPTDFILLSDNSNTGIISGNRFAIATNDTAKLTIGTGLMWVANATEAGWSTARPA